MLNKGYDKVPGVSRVMLSGVVRANTTKADYEIILEKYKEDVCCKISRNKRPPPDEAATADIY